MNQEIDVVRAVRCAYERLAAGGVKSGSAIGSEAKGESAREREITLMLAREVVDAVATLDARFNLALMARVNDGSMAFLDFVFPDLVSFVRWDHWVDEAGGVQVRERVEVMRFGLAGLQYWVRYWLVGFGSSRDFGSGFGVSHETAAVFYREHIKPLLHGWFVGACGALEPVLWRHAEMDVLEVA